jgi:hypothetical protein
MNPKRVVGIILTVIVLLLLVAGVRLAQSRSISVAEAPRVPPAQPITQPQEAAGHAAVPALIPPQETFAGAVMAQTFTLSAGWNAIYLGVEPINLSPLVDPSKPELGHTQSLMEAIFGPLGAKVDSVWTYNQPVSNKDYIIDPGEGLWDEPGWERYIPDSNVDENGQSRAFLTTLHTLHANTGYLVKMNAAGSITVTGKPVPGHHRWKAGAYNLAGFPIGPGQSTTVANFVPGYPATSPITEIRALNSNGTWTTAMAGTAPLTSGAAYLVRYANEPADPDYTAPLDVGTSDVAMILPTEGLEFQAGFQGNSTMLRLENLAADAVDVTLALPEGMASKVAVHYVTNDNPPVVIADLRSGPATISLGAAGAAPANVKWIKLQVPTDEQPTAGETLLEISSGTLGTRWLIPVSAQPGSYAGLWVGDVVVNDVSEARLGATDAAHDLTIALAPKNASGVRGAAEIHEELAGPASTLHMMVTLTLPAETVESAASPAVTAPYVHGYVFIDANRNGQRDATEKGLASVAVTATRQDGSYSKSGATLADGSYWLDHLNPGTYNLQIATPGGYTSTFTVEVPAEDVAGDAVKGPNVIPATVTLDATGAIEVTPESYLAQILPEPPPYLPYYDAYDNRVEPPLNLGLVRADEAWLGYGLCDQPRGTPVSLGIVRNGQLNVDYAAKLADLVDDAHIRITRNGADVACGNLVVGAPTVFSDGRGSAARFRILLRVKGTASGQTELVPYYEMTSAQRVSAVNFLSLQTPKVNGSAIGFGTTGEALVFDLTLPPADPLNPFKHKYNPDHDNLDRKFQEYAETVPLYMYESYLVNRQVTLVLTMLPPGGDKTSTASVDWGGAVWGGDYREVVEGLHKNTITARGYFVIRRVLTAEQLTTQSYDK